MFTRKSAYPVLAFITAVLAAIFTPTPDAVSTLLWWLILLVVFAVVFEFVRFMFGR